MRMYEVADKARRCKAWYSSDIGISYGGEVVTRRHVMHYSTVMLSFVVGEDGKWDGDMSTVDYSIGHGSVSDQNGMNKLFAYLGMPLYYSRAGGATIDELDRPQYRYGISKGA